MALPNSHASGAIDMQNVIANFKEIYGEFRDLVPADLKFTDMVKFAGGDKKIGNEYHEPVVLSMEGGITYGGSEGAVFDLNSYVALTMKDAKVKSSEMVLRSAISVATVSRSQTDKQSFKRGMTLLIANMMRSMYHRLEVALLYGQDGLGIVESATPQAANTELVIKIKDSEWAAGIWTGTNNHLVEIFDPTLVTRREIASSAFDFIIKSYNFETKEIVLKRDQNASVASHAVMAGDKIFFKGEVIADATPIHLNMKGLKSIAEERTSLFSISNANVPLFQGNLVDCGTSMAPKYLDFATVEKAAARGVEKGVSDVEMQALVSVHSWNDLLIDQAAKRRYSGSEVGKLKEGGRELEFYGQTGVISITPSTYVKEGYAFTFCKQDLIRIGATDVTMEPPGFEGEPIRFLENSNGYQARAYSDQALFTSRPGGISVIRYVTNSKNEPNL